MTRRIIFMLADDTTETHCGKCAARVVDMCMSYGVQMHRDPFMGARRHAECRSAELRPETDALREHAEKAERFIATADSEWRARAEKAERARDEAVAAIAAAERRIAAADVSRADAEDRRILAGSNAIEWESRAKNAERALAAAGKSADAIRAMLGGADDLVIAIRCLGARAEKAERERGEALQRRTRAERVGEAVIKWVEGESLTGLYDSIVDAMKEADDAE